MPLEALQSCLMIPFSCTHCYLAFSCHVLLNTAMMLFKSTFWHSLSWAAHGQSGILEQTWLSRIWRKVLSKTGCPYTANYSSHYWPSAISATFTHLWGQRVSTTWDVLTAVNVVVMSKYSLGSPFYSCIPDHYAGTKRTNILFSKQAESSLWIK